LDNCLTLNRELIGTEINAISERVVSQNSIKLSSFEFMSSFEYVLGHLGMLADY